MGPIVRCFESELLANESPFPFDTTNPRAARDFARHCAFFTLLTESWNPHKENSAGAWTR